MRAISSMLGFSSPFSHLETVPWDTFASFAISACVRSSIALRMWWMAFMPDTLFENELIRQGILFENEFAPRIPFNGIGGGFSMQVDHILREIGEATRWKQAQMGKAFKVGQGTISKWISGAQSPNKKQWDRVVAVIMRDARLAHLRQPIQIGGAAPVMGKIGAGALIDPDFDQSSSEGLYEVSLPFPATDDVIALVVDGESMAPKYDPGDIIVVRREQLRATNWYLGKLVAIRTEDGRRYLKKLFQGSVDGLYRLESLNADPIHNVSVQWVGEIFAIVPAIQAVRIDVAKKKTAPPSPASKPAR